VEETEPVVDEVEEQLAEEGGFVHLVSVVVHVEHHVFLEFCGHADQLQIVDEQKDVAGKQQKE
jgi:hypothetical protein